MNRIRSRSQYEGISSAISRRDIAIEDNRDVAKALEPIVVSVPDEALPQEESLAPISPRDNKRFHIRQTLVESPLSDPNGFERIIGASDLVSVNYLTRGIRVAAAVCRIRVPAQDGEWYGTGFLVGPRLLMTNNHVLSSRSEASQTEAEFNFEHDLDGVLNPSVQFNLAPHEIFFTDLEHDVTFVAVSQYSEGGVPIDRFGYLPLIPLSGKAIEGEWVTIIQHPGGQPKQIAVRHSRIMALSEEEFPLVSARNIHYTIDTEPGSSGSPVLNDQWQVVAIHHKAVPDPSVSIDDIRNAHPSEIKWVANQGVRISSIYAKLESQRFSDTDAASVLQRLSRALGFTPMTFADSPSLNVLASEKEGKPFPIDKWSDQNYGYDPDFLSTTIDLDTILSDRRNDATPLKDRDDKVVLDYLHFSSVIDKSRRFPMLTAVNIHGGKLRHPGKNNSNSWRRDIRVDEVFQPGDNLYVKGLGDDRVAFDRGHLVRRLDPCWGDSDEEARLAERHTFHFSNAVPQVHKYNDIDWGNLEDYILEQTQTLERKVTIFTGPVFRDQDPPYGHTRENGPWKIPVTFWKIAVVQKPGGKISAAAFMIGQIEYLTALFEARVFTGLKPYTYDELKTRMIQTTVKTVESETGFDFSAIRKFDAQDALESTRQTRFIRGISDIII